MAEDANALFGVLNAELTGRFCRWEQGMRRGYISIQNNDYVVDVNGLIFSRVLLTQLLAHLFISSVKYKKENY